MLRVVDSFARHVVGIPLALIGLGLSYLSAACIVAGAWICDVDLDAEE